MRGNSSINLSVCFDDSNVFSMLRLARTGRAPRIEWERRFPTTAIVFQALVQRQR